jgi:hypothetical protein
MLDSAARREDRKIDQPRRVEIEMDARASFFSPKSSPSRFFSRGPAKIVKAFTGRIRGGEVCVTL